MGIFGATGFLGAANAGSTLSGIGSAIGAIGGLGNKGPSARKLAAEANEFTEKMMRNRHQMEVDDLRKAGLNPMLSAGGTPSMGQSHMAEYVNPVDNRLKTVTAAKELALLGEQLKNVRADTVLKGAQANSADAAAGLANVNSAASAQNIGIKKPLAGIMDWSARAVDAGGRNVQHFLDLLSGKRKLQFDAVPASTRVFNRLFGR